MTSKEPITADDVVTCSCGRKYRHNPKYSEYRLLPDHDGYASTDDPAGWIIAMGCCPSCYDKHHGGTGDNNPEADEWLCKDEEEAVNKDVVCPFCGERDFDLIGLKIHLLNYCEKYRDTPLFDAKR
jgi:hypothetical protein